MSSQEGRAQEPRVLTDAKIDALNAPERIRNRQNKNPLSKKEQIEAHAAYMRASTVIQGRRLPRTAPEVIFETIANRIVRLWKHGAPVRETDVYRELKAAYDVGFIEGKLSVEGTRRRA